MTKTERIHLISVAAKLETVAERLNQAVAPINSKERICIVCEQINAIHGIIGDILKGGESA